jgi:CTP:molybdopterin cytidylyltransferase MocA
MIKKNGFRITGLILAGGLAERMGECKALLTFGRAGSALEMIVTRMRASGVGSVIVVTGGHEETVREETLRLGCEAFHNPAFKSGMFSSVITGVKALKFGVEAFFLQPVDIPLVKISTYKALIEAWDEGHGAPQIVYPTFMGERGHPPLIGREMIAPILGWTGKRGLQGLLDDCPRSLDIPTADRAILLDMDTQDDYRRLRRYIRNEKFPDDDECAELLIMAGTPNKIVRHMKVVADCALRIADAYAQNGVKVNTRLLLSGCLLHDIAKGEKDHEARGAHWLRERGYSRVAKLVASHKDLPDKKSSCEAEILYLSDKITDGEAISTLKNRMLRMRERLAPGSESLATARRRIKQAWEIQRKVEKITGRSLDEIVHDV